MNEWEIARAVIARDNKGTAKATKCRLLGQRYGQRDILIESVSSGMPDLCATAPSHRCDNRSRRMIKELSHTRCIVPVY